MLSEPLCALVILETEKPDFQLKGRQVTLTAIAREKYYNLLFESAKNSSESNSIIKRLFFAYLAISGLLLPRFLPIAKDDHTNLDTHATDECIEHDYSHTMLISKVFCSTAKSTRQDLLNTLQTTNAHYLTLGSKSPRFFFITEDQKPIYCYVTDSSKAAHFFPGTMTTLCCTTTQNCATVKGNVHMTTDKPYYSLNSNTVLKMTSEMQEQENTFSIDPARHPSYTFARSQYYSSDC